MNDWQIGKRLAVAMIFFGLSVVVVFLLSSFGCSCSAIAQLAPPSKTLTDPKVAYVQDDEIYVSSIDGTGVRQLTRDGQPKDLPRWAPDGTSLLYVESTKPAVPNTFVKLVLIDGAGKLLQRMPVLQESGGQNSEIYNDMNYIDGAGWAGNSTIYITGSNSPYVGTLESFNIKSGAHDLWLGNSFAGCPAINSLAYFEDDADKPGNQLLKIGDVDGEAIQTLLSVPDVLWPYSLQWSSDCERLLFRERNSTDKHLDEKDMVDDKEVELVILKGKELESRLVVKGDPHSITVYSLKGRFGVKIDPDNYFLYDPPTRSLLPRRHLSPRSGSNCLHRFWWGIFPRTRRGMYGIRSNLYSECAKER